MGDAARVTQPVAVLAETSCMGDESLVREYVQSRTHIRILTIAVLTLAAAVLSIIAFQKALRFQGNFHAVVVGEFYRSAQLSPKALQEYIGEYGIRTIVNLRGAAPNAKWYQDEKAIAGSLGVTFIDFGMSATRRLTAEHAMDLIARLRDAPKPILVHCLDGADRSGLVSVIYASQVTGTDEETAEKQLSIFYGHVGIPFLSPTFAMDLSWEELETFFGISNS